MSYRYLPVSKGLANDAARNIAIIKLMYVQILLRSSEVKCAGLFLSCCAYTHTYWWCVWEIHLNDKKTKLGKSRPLRWEYRPSPGADVNKHSGSLGTDLFDNHKATWLLMLPFQHHSVANINDKASILKWERLDPAFGYGINRLAFTHIYYTEYQILELVYYLIWDLAPPYVATISIFSP